MAGLADDPRAPPHHHRRLIGPELLGGGLQEGHQDRDHLPIGPLPSGAGWELDLTRLEDNRQALNERLRNHDLGGKLLNAAAADGTGAWRLTPVNTCLYTHGAVVMEAIPSRVFMNGNSQAVRIPAELRLSTDRVQISRTAEGDLLIHPCPAQRGQTLLQTLADFDADFVAALEQQQAQKLPMQDRDLL